MILVTDGAIIAHKYRLQRPLGRGGMGSVWLARHMLLDVDVAIKFISAEYVACPEARLRFEREAKISAQLRAPNVAHVYDYGVDDGTPYIVMELLNGEDLAARLLRERRLDPSAVLSIVQQVCKALRRAHEAGLVHRDLKPANIFHARHDGDEHDEIVKILDFGIAKMTGIGAAGSVTKAGTLLGSPYYMSPEQVRRSKDVDHRSDLWSLGVITFQCLTGQLPFQGEDLGELILEIYAADVALASSRVPGFESALGPFFTRALSREPSDRFQSAQEFVAAFAAVEGLFAPPKVRALALSTEECAPPIVPDAHKPSASTLSPTGHSLVVLEKHGRRMGAVFMAVACVLAIAVLFVAVRSKHDTETDKPTGPSNAMTPGQPLDPLEAFDPPASSSIREPVASALPSVNAAPQVVASVMAGSSAGQTPRPPSPSVVAPKKNTQTIKKPKAKRDDPTNRM